MIDAVMRQVDGSPPTCGKVLSVFGGRELEVQGPRLPSHPLKVCAELLHFGVTEIGFVQFGGWGRDILPQVEVIGKEVPVYSWGSRSIQQRVDVYDEE